MHLCPQDPELPDISACADIIRAVMPINNMILTTIATQSGVKPKLQYINTKIMDNIEPATNMLYLPTLSENLPIIGPRN
jgi:hypothetical protein